MTPLFVACLLLLLQWHIMPSQGQSFDGITAMQGYLSAWTTTGTYGCPAAYELSTSGAHSMLAALPCSSDSHLSVNLTGYSPTLGLIKSSTSTTNTSFYYSILATSGSRPLILGTFSAQTGTVVQLLEIGITIDPVVMHVDPVSGYIYLVAWQRLVLTTLFIYVIDPTQLQWQDALITSPVPVVPSYNILPAGSTWAIRDEFTCSAYVSSLSQLLLIMGSITNVTSSPQWHLLSITPLTGIWYEIVVNDPSILASGSLSMTWLGPSSIVLLSSESGAWLLETLNSGVTTSTTFQVTAVSQHLSRAQQALGCGEVMVAVSAQGTIIPSSNSSSLPYTVLFLYAIPTLLSAIQMPFWYMLFIDSTLNQVTYLSIDTPPLLVDQLIPASSVTTVRHSNGGVLAYNAQNGASLIWQGEFYNDTSYICATNSSRTISTFINGTTLTCTLPSGLNNSFISSGTTTWLPVQLLAEGAFVLYQSQLLVVTTWTFNVFINASILPSDYIGRMVVSYSVASALTPSPVISAASIAFATTTTASGITTQASPLQLHSQLTSGLTFVTQQLLTVVAQYPEVQVSQVISSVRSTLSELTKLTSTGINDAYALLASAATLGSIDFQTMMTSCASLTADDTSSLPQTLIGLSTGTATSLALDIIGSQAQAWLIENIGAVNSSDLSSVLNLGAILPGMSSNVLASLSSLTVNAALQSAIGNPIIGDVLNDPTISPLLNLPNDLNGVLDDPTDIVASFFPAGAIKDTVMNLLRGSIGDRFTTVLAGSMSDQANNIIYGLGDGLSNIVDTVQSIGSSFIDDISRGAIDVESSSFGGVVGSVSSVVLPVFGASSQAQNLVSGAISTVGGIADCFCGDLFGGIGSIISGLGNLFGFGSGTDEMQLLAQQMTQDFNQVFQDLSSISNQINSDVNTILTDIGSVQSNLLNADQQLSSQLNQGFNALANLSIAEFTQLQQHQYDLYSSEMTALADVAQGVQSNAISLTAAQQQLAYLLTFVEDTDFQVLQSERSTLLSTVQGYMNDITTSIGAVQTDTAFLTRSIPQPYLQTYQDDMNQVCSWATGVNEAAATAMSGDPADSTQTVTDAISVSPYYDLVFSWIPLIVSQYLSQPLPAILEPSIVNNLPNPLAYAFATNFWLEARQAALQTPLLSDANCLPALWQTGQQLQAAVRLAVAPTTLAAAYAKLNSSIDPVLASLNASFEKNGTLTLSNLQNFIMGLNIAQSPFAAFDDICSISMLLLTIGQGAGLGSNGFTNGFVSNGIASGFGAGLPASLQPGQYGTRLIPFATVVSTATLASSLVRSLAATSNAAANGVLVPQVITSQAETLLLLTLASMRNAIDSFYSPCAPLPLTITRSLPSIDVTLRRLAGYMMQTQTSFMYQSQPISLDAPQPIHIAPPSTSSTGAATASTSPSSYSASSVSLPPSSVTPLHSSIGSITASSTSSSFPASFSSAYSFHSSSGLESVGVATSINVPAVVGGVVGAVLVVSLLTLLIVLYCYRRAKKTNTSSIPGHFSSGAFAHSDTAKSYIYAQNGPIIPARSSYAVEMGHVSRTTNSPEPNIQHNYV